MLATEWLKAARQKAVAGLLKLSWDEIRGIMERAVKRGLERRKAELVGQIGVDEKAFRKGHSYLTLVNDLIRGRVLYLAEDRFQTSRPKASFSISATSGVPRHDRRDDEQIIGQDHEPFDSHQ